MQDAEYRDLIKNAPFAFAHHKIILDENDIPIDYEFVEINEAFAKLTGLKKSHIIGNRVTKLIPDIINDPFNWISFYGEIALNLGQKEFEQYAQGIKKWYKVQVFSTQKYYFSTLFIDISKEKEKKEELEGFFSVNLNLLCILDLKGYLISLNSDWENLLGYTIEELKEKSIFDFIHKDDFSLLFNVFENMGNNQKTENFIIRLKTEYSDYRYIEWRANLKNDRIYASARDITERKISEEVLKESEEQHRLLFETSQEGILVAQGNNLSYFNPMILDITGYTSDELSNINFVDLVYPDDRELLLRNYKKRLAGEKVEKRYQIRIIRKDKSIIWTEVSGVKLNWKGIPSTLNFINDITEEKFIQQKLIETNRQLELANKQAIEMTKKADSANKAKSEFLSNMSHEIRTPLNGVIGFTDLLLKTPLTNIQQQYVENAHISANSLLGVINDILDFSKIEAGKMELDLVKTDIIELLEKSADIIKYQSSQKGLELLLNIQPYMPRFAIVDPIRLKQILVNLLGNAVKFTEKGQIELKVSFIPKNASFGFFTFSIIDTGIGINESQQKKLFKAFSQADSSTTRKFGGTGLGLIISNMLAKKMNTQISIESQIGKGSNFFFTIETEYIFEKNLEYISLEKINRVLVVDDNDSNRSILEKYFLNWNIDFVGVDNGLSALKLLEKDQNFDVIIVDHHMDYLDGLYVIKEIRTKLNLSSEKIAIILLNSLADTKEFYNESKNLEINSIITKPLKYRDLFNKLKSIYNNEHSDSRNVVSINNIEIIKTSFDPVILIAEDVTMNMILVKTIIKQLIPNTIFLEAKNGKEAFDIAIKQKLDLILMDIQMPEMSGLDATLAIRNYEENNLLNYNTPIIALTAGAIKEERENCFKVGMDDFITKPIERESLFKILSKYLSKKESIIAEI